MLLIHYSILFKKYQLQNDIKYPEAKTSGLCQIEQDKAQLG